MTREEAKELLPIIQAYAEGKTIECKCKNPFGSWTEAKCPSWSVKLEYRIKPEQKYRPFKNQEECWNEMHKHPDFGWVIAKDSKIMYYICVVAPGYVLIDSMSPIFFEAFTEYKFTDGTPFGIKEE